MPTEVWQIVVNSGIAGVVLFVLATKGVPALAKWVEKFIDRVFSQIDTFIAQHREDIKEIISNDQKRTDTIMGKLDKQDTRLQEIRDAMAGWNPPPMKWGPPGTPADKDKVA